MTSLFCIVDPELKDNNPTGHCLAYDQSLCKAARKNGIATLILGRTTLKAIDENSEASRAIFTRGLWEIHPDDFIHQTLFNDVKIFLSDIMIPPATSEQNLNSLGLFWSGLYLTLKNSKRISPFVKYLNNSPDKRSYFRAGIKFFKELREGLKDTPFDRNAFILAQHVSGPDLFGWAIFALYCHIYSGPRIGIILRYEAQHYKEFLKGFELLEDFAEEGRVIYFSDSTRLIRDFSDYTRSLIKLIPIPHAHGVSEIESLDRDSKFRPIIFGSLGGAREDKGFCEICEAIIQIEEKVLLKDIQFILHAHSPNNQKVIESLTRLKAKNLPNVKIIEKSLDQNEYADLLSLQDVILMPYQRDLYPSRTSGVLSEAMCAGKICIVTDDTWLSDELSERGAGVLCQSECTEDLVKAIVTVSENFKELNHSARLKSKQAQEWHNPDKTIEILLNPQSHS